MTELSTAELRDDEMVVARTAGPTRARGVRRRPMARVLTICGFIVATVWGINYAGSAGEVVSTLRENGQSALPLRLLDPLVVARTCPIALATLLGLLVGFFALLRTKAAARIERAVLSALEASGERRARCAEQLSRSYHSPTSLPLTLAPIRKGQNWRWIVAGMLLVAAAIAILEIIEPCYFAQDDNLVTVLPGILQGCRAIFQGDFPDFDPFQFMGMPSAGKGTCTLLYPPTVASYATARWLLGNDNWTLEVFAAMHLLAGYVACFAAARVAGLRPALAFALGISFVLCGYILLVGRGWHSVLTLAFWLPMLFCSIETWRQGSSGWRWLFGSGLAIGGFYYMGFPQFWVYGMLFMALAAIVTVACGGVAKRQLAWPAAAMLLGMALILPSLVVQLEITRGMKEKPVNAGMGVEQGLLATFAPYPLTHAEGFMELPANRDRDLQTQWYYAGTPLMVGGYLVLGSLLMYRCRRQWLAAHPWTVVAVVSLWLGLGSAGILWNLLGRLPLVRAVNHHPHRLLPFFVFFALLLGGQFLERLIHRAASRKWEYVIAAVTAALMLYHVSLARNSLWSYGDRPFPPLPPEIAQRVLPSDCTEAGRVVWEGPARTGRPGFAWLLPFSLPSAYGALGFGGYDPIIEARPETLAIQARFANDPLAAARAYGVRWILAANPNYYRGDRDYWQAVRKNDWCFGYREDDQVSAVERILPAAQSRFANDAVSLYELSGASGIAFDRQNPDIHLPVHFRGWGADVDTRGGASRKIVVNVAMRPWVRAAAGETELPTGADAWGRVEVEVPQGVERFRIYYDLPWLRGLALGGGLLFSTIIGMVFVKRRL